MADDQPTFADDSKVEPLPTFAADSKVEPLDGSAGPPKSFTDRLSNTWENATPGGPLWMIREATRGMHGAVEGAKAAVAPQVGTEEEEYNRRALAESGPGQTFRAAQFMSPSAPGGSYVSRGVAALEGEARPPPAVRAPIEPTPPPLPAEAAFSVNRVPRENVGVSLLPPEVPHELPAMPAAGSLSAARSSGPLNEVSPETIAHMRKVMEEQGFTPHTIDQRLEELSSHHFLGEITPSLEADMGAVAAPPGPAKLEVMNSIRQRALEAPQRVRAAFDRAFGGNENVSQLRRIIEGDRARESEPFYRIFDNTEITPTPQLTALMPRLEAAGALRSANQALRIEGQPATRGFSWRPTEETGLGGEFNISAPGEGVQQVPTASAFQYAKEALDKQIEQAIAAPGGANEARHLTGLKNDLVRAIDEHPDPNVAGVWQQARSTYARPTEILDSIRMGQRVLTEHIHADDLPFLTATYSPEQMNGLRVGMRSALENVLNKKDTLTAEVINKVLSPANIDKMRWAIGDEATERLVSAIEHERHMHTAPTRVHGGSPTALRLEAQKRWTPQPGALSNVTLGDVAGAVTSPVKTSVKAAEHFGLSARRAKAEAKFAKLREESARLMTLQGPERDAVARWLVNGNVQRARGGAVHNHNPTEPQKQAGNYSKTHRYFQGLDITLENLKGHSRSGVGKDGKRWSVKMPASYGYLKRTEGADGDHVDVYLGSNEKSDQVFVVDQKDAGSGRFDEHKVLLAFSSEKEALATYRAGFSDGKDRVKHVRRMTMAEFKTWLAKGDTSKPIKRYAKGGAVQRALSAARGYADGGTPFDDAPDDGAMMPETFVPGGARDLAMQAAPKDVATIRGGIEGLATLPQRALQSAETYRQTGEYDPGPILEAATLPMGTGAVAGLQMRAGETALGAGPIRAYHGSPHDFDRFDMSKIGTGEGAQAYGHGLYFAGNEGVARSYRDTLAGANDVMVNREIQQHGGLDKAIKHNQQGVDAYSLIPEEHVQKNANLRDQKAEYEFRLGKLKEYEKNPDTTGKMYEVNIDADPEHFLDWDKPLNQQHPQTLNAVKQAMGPNWDQFKFANAGDAVKRGFIAPGEETTAARLREAGVPGVKYLDQGSRASGEGSHNYVVFNDKLLNILRKYRNGGRATYKKAVQ